MEHLHTRATIRQYANKEVSNEILYPLLELAARTQTMGNLQLYSVIITRDEAMKEKLNPLHFNQPMVKSAPVIVTVCADFRRTTRWCEEREATAGYQNFLSFLNAASDALLYTQTFCNLIEANGLGVCYLGTTLYTAPQIIEVLALPQLVFPIATLTIGYPAEAPAPSDRLSANAFIHQERYEDYSKEQIDAYYLPKERLPENQHFVSINQKQTLAQVFADIRYKKADNEMFSQTLLEALRQQGFL